MKKSSFSLIVFMTLLFWIAVQFCGVKSSSNSHKIKSLYSVSNPTSQKLSKVSLKKVITINNADNNVLNERIDNPTNLNKISSRVSI